MVGELDISAFGDGRGENGDQSSLRESMIPLTAAKLGEGQDFLPEADGPREFALMNDSSGTSEADSVSGGGMPADDFVKSSGYDEESGCELNGGIRSRESVP